MRSLFFVLLLFAAILTGCAGEKASFGEGDEAFTVDMVTGSYELSSITNNVILLKGSVDLKICNKGQKSLYFAIPDEVGGIFIDFQPQHETEVVETSRPGLEKLGVRANEGPVDIIPGMCPTYTYYFERKNGIKYNNENYYFSMDAYKQADYYFFIGDQKWKLSGSDNLVSLAEKTEAKGVAEQDYKDYMKKLDTDGMKLGEQYCFTLTDMTLMKQCADLSFQLAVVRNTPNKDVKYCELLKAKNACVSALGMTEAELVEKIEGLG